MADIQIRSVGLIAGVVVFKSNSPGRPTDAPAGAICPSRVALRVKRFVPSAYATRAENPLGLHLTERSLSDKKRLLAGAFDLIVDRGHSLAR